MRNRFFLGVMTLCLLGGVTSCKDEVDEYDDHGGAQIVSFSGADMANMGDSISFDFEVKSSGIKINQAKVQLYYGEKLVSEEFYVLKADGKYKGKVLAPYLKDVDDSDAKVVLRIQNERFVSDSRELTVPVSRPKYQTLKLVAADGTEYIMKPVPGKEYEFAAREAFPPEMQAKIVAPAYSDGSNPYLKGNELKFGMDNGRIALGASDAIGFETTGYGDDGKYEITFNTRTFECGPFPKFGVRIDTQNKFYEFEGSGNVFYIEQEFKKDDVIKISGIKDEYAGLWKSPTWFDGVEGDETLLHFRGRDGKYKLILDKGTKSIVMEQLENASTSNTLNATAMWAIGDGNIGFPSAAKNAIKWDPSKAINLCPLTATKYELVVKVGQEVNSNNQFKFFGQKNWGKEWGAGSFNVKEGGELVSGYADGGDFMFNNLQAGKYLVITAETNVAPAEYYIKLLDEMPLYDPNK